VPIATRRRGGEVEVVTGAPIVPGPAGKVDEREIALARSTAAWFESYL